MQHRPCTGRPLVPHTARARSGVIWPSAASVLSRHQPRVGPGVGHRLSLHPAEFGCSPERADGVRRCAGPGGQACLYLAGREGQPVGPPVGSAAARDCRLALYRLRRKP